MAFTDRNKNVAGKKIALENYASAMHKYMTRMFN